MNPFAGWTPAQIEAHNKRIEESRKRYRDRPESKWALEQGTKLTDDEVIEKFEGRDPFEKLPEYLATQLAMDHGEAIKAGIQSGIEQMFPAVNFEREHMKAVASESTRLLQKCQDSLILFKDVEPHHKHFTVKVCPMGAPRMNRSVCWKPTEAHKRYFKFKDALRLAVGPIEVPDEIEITAFIPMAASWPKKKVRAMHGQPHRNKPDFDNIAKGVCDALFDDDCSIWCGTCRKFWCGTGEERIELKLTYYFEA